MGRYALRYGAVWRAMEHAIECYADAMVRYSARGAAMGCAMERYGAPWNAKAHTIPRYAALWNAMAHAMVRYEVLQNDHIQERDLLTACSQQSIRSSKHQKLTTS